MSQFNVDGPVDSARPYDSWRFHLPSHWRVDVADLGSVQPLKDPTAGIAQALVDPLNSPPLAELVGPGDHVCITFTHPSISCPEHLLVPALLRELEQAGVHDEDITLLCAGGLYGRTSYDEKVAQLGADIVTRYRVVDHSVSDVIHLGQWQSIPLTVNRCALEADLVVATGVVAPHLYAGYSGGAETVAIGCAGDTTIEAIHAPRFIYHPQVRPGQVKGNPFQEVMWEAAQRAGLRFSLNAVLDPLGKVVDVQAGDPFMVHQYLVFAASSLYNSLVNHTYDVVIAGIDPPNDADLYQAVLGALFVGMAPNTALRTGGVILLPVRTPEAVGQGINAQNFYSALQGVRSLDTLITELLERGYRPGEARAFQLARLLELNEVVVVGSDFPAIVEACHLQRAADMPAALDLTRWLLGDDLDVLIIPHALHTLPVPTVPDQDEWRGVALANTQTW
jgi:nickel-dependent lactate racemase